MKNRIRVERAEVRMTQQQLADAIGVSRQTVNAIEAGRFVPSTVLALKIARIFGKPVEKPTIGDADRPAERADIRRANRLLYTSSLLMMVLIVLIAIVR